MEHFVQSGLKTLCILLFALGATASANGDMSVIDQMGLEESSSPLREMSNWAPPKKIVVLAENEARVQYFLKAAPDVQIVGVRGPREAMAQLSDADALVGMCSPQLVANAPKLKWVQSQLAGVDDCIEVPRIQNGEILFTNMQRVNGSNVAEHAMALTLTLTRRLNAALENQAEGSWNRRGLGPPLDLDGATMLVVGLGGIGTEIARRARAFNMRVIATRNSSRNGPAFVSYVGLADELPELISEADVVINATPLTPATEGLFNSELFGRMKRTAYFINIGRGGSVVTSDLVDALQSGTIAGAGLDVTDPEPLPDNHPLWSTPNVVITPHVAGASQIKLDRMWAVFRENIRRFAAGDKMLSVVSVEQGY